MYNLFYYELTLLIIKLLVENGSDLTSFLVLLLKFIGVRGWLFPLKKSTKNNSIVLWKDNTTGLCSNF